MKYILAQDYDEECFDYDGFGDYIKTSTSYTKMGTKKELLAYLKKNIYYEDRKTKPNFSSIKKYCDAFGFRIYKIERQK